MVIDLALGMALCVADRAVVKKCFPGEDASESRSIILAPGMAQGEVRVPHGV
jgi:hypothetical protein